MTNDTSRVQPKRGQIKVKSKNASNDKKSASCKKSPERKTLNIKKIEKGQLFGRLRAISQIDENLWLMQCSCGNKKIVKFHNIKYLGTKSCGCLQKEAASKASTKHGLSRIPEYRIWSSMIGRCHTLTDKAYPFYGGRGIIVCKKWRSSFCQFLKDMGRRPDATLSIHRIDNDKGYCPTNCKWATRKEQTKFRSVTRFHYFNGQSLMLSEWSEKTGLPENMLHQRINKLGWSVEKALTTPKLSSLHK